jgi:hypothetical protein
MIITYHRPQLKSWTDLLHRPPANSPKLLPLCSPKVAIVDESTKELQTWSNNSFLLGAIPSFSKSLKYQEFLRGLS